MVLKDIAYYVDDSISSDTIEINQYVTTDCLLQNKEGRTLATNLPPQPCSLTHYLPGDVLIANIRPYLKKVWKADIEGGCSKDVLVIRAKENHIAEYIYALSLQEAFFENAMLGTKGTQMPRGDKDKIMEFPVFDYKQTDELKIGSIFDNIQNKIALNYRMNAELEAMAKQLYDYWFVQFDFPDENGKPYKSSGGKMVYNSTLKREIPAGWEDCKLEEITDVVNGATPLTSNPANYGSDIVWITPNDLSNQKNKFISCGERSISQKGYDSCSTSLMPKGSVLMSSRAPIGLIAIAEVELCTNQGFKSFVPFDMIDNYFLYYYLKEHLQQIEQLGAGTTFREVSRDTMLKFPILRIIDRELYTKWYEQISIICNEQTNLLHQIRELTHLRDSLLPMLMNGQVTVE